MNRTQEYFDGQFSDYDEAKGNAWGMNWRAYMVYRTDKILSFLERYIQSMSPTVILEIGCATGDFTGRYLPLVEDSGGNILGVDIVQKAIDICNGRFNDKNCCEFQIGKLPEIKLDKHFDIVLCMDVMEYFDDKERIECYQNIAEILKNGGVMLLQMPITGEDIDTVRKQVEDFFVIESEDYIYGQLWYKLVEEKLFWIVENLYFKVKGFPLNIIGWLSYMIMSSRCLVRLTGAINRICFPKLKSHVIMCCRKG